MRKEPILLRCWAVVPVGVRVERAVGKFSVDILRAGLAHVRERPNPHLRAVVFAEASPPWNSRECGTFVDPSYLKILRWGDLTKACSFAGIALANEYANLLRDPKVCAAVQNASEERARTLRGPISFVGAIPRSEVVELYDNYVGGFGIKRMAECPFYPAFAAMNDHTPVDLALRIEECADRIAAVRTAGLPPGCDQDWIQARTAAYDALFKKTSRKLESLAYQELKALDEAY